MASLDTEGERYEALLAHLRELAATGGLPPRYAEAWDTAFFEVTRQALRPGGTVIDLGAGARPTIKPEDRPPGCDYVGVDISRAELDRAPAGSYSSVHALDVSAPGASLPVGPADLVMSWQVLEHVRSMSTSLENMHRWLAPGGQLVALLSGSLALSSVVSRVMPHGLRSRLTNRLYGNAAEDKFPTVYDACRASQLRRLLAGRWASFEVMPRYRGANYLAFSPPLLRAYLAYENLVERQGIAELATHYVVHATK
jgi:SAM-dependent methyltransferase